MIALSPLSSARFRYDPIDIRRGKRYVSFTNSACRMKSSPGERLDASTSLHPPGPPYLGNCGFPRCWYSIVIPPLSPYNSYSRTRTTVYPPEPPVQGFVVHLPPQQPEETAGHLSRFCIIRREPTAVGCDCQRWHFRCRRVGPSYRCIDLIDLALNLLYISAYLVPSPSKADHVK
jgi:hypothetical protein